MATVNYPKARLENGELVLGPIKQIDPRKCPHFIMVGEHYRDNGTCRCDDPTCAEMADWGYVWSDETARWEAGPDED